jgi:hypothetical protein
MAGYPVSADTTPPERPTGDIGIGRGGGAVANSQRQQPSMNDLLRAAAGAKSMVAGDLAEQLAFERVRGG